MRYKRRKSRLIYQWHKRSQRIIDRTWFRFAALMVGVGLIGWSVAGFPTSVAAIGKDTPIAAPASSNTADSSTSSSSSTQAAAAKFDQAASSDLSGNSSNTSTPSYTPNANGQPDPPTQLTPVHSGTANSSSSSTGTSTRSYTPNANGQPNSPTQLTPVHSAGTNTTTENATNNTSRVTTSANETNTPQVVGTHQTQESPPRYTSPAVVYNSQVNNQPTPIPQQETVVIKPAPAVSSTKTHQVAYVAPSSGCTQPCKVPAETTHVSSAAKTIHYTTSQTSTHYCQTTCTKQTYASTTSSTTCGQCATTVAYTAAPVQYAAPTPASPPPSQLPSTGPGAGIAVSLFGVVGALVGRKYAAVPKVKKLAHVGVKFRV